MTVRERLFKGARSPRTKQLLWELYNAGEIAYLAESGLFARGALTARRALDLLMRRDRLLSEQVAEVERMIARYGPLPSLVRRLEDLKARWESLPPWEEVTDEPRGPG